MLGEITAVSFVLAGLMDACLFHVRFSDKSSQLSHCSVHLLSSGLYDLTISQITAVCLSYHSFIRFSLRKPHFLKTFFCVPVFGVNVRENV